MATKKTNLKEMNDESLHKLLDEKKEELRTQKFGLGGGKNKNVLASRMIRKSIAQVLTEVTSRKAK